MKSWLSNEHIRHPLLIPVLVISVILAVYYPSMFSGIHPIDDPGIFSLYSASPPLSQILLPGNGYYYRPLVELSFWIDNCLWGMEPVVMHLENILLHCANSLLVYLLARKILRRHDHESLLIPLLAALLFALHPANVEAVAWIAGRTDPLLALFALSACCFWLDWLDRPRWQVMTISMVLFGAALLTKETALAAGAVVFLLSWACPGTATARQRMMAVGAMLVPGVLLVMFALVFRSDTSGLRRFITGTHLPAGQSIREALIAFGFYAKKLIVPYPLNFGITEVHPIYCLVGVAVIPLLCWAVLRMRLMGVLFTSTTMLLLPAVLVAVKQIAWTPYAERYLYLPSAFCAIGLAVLIQSCWKQFWRPAVLLVLLVLAGFTFISAQRAILWNNKLAFIQDAIAKSPGFGSLYNELGGILIQRGEIDRAADAFETADHLNNRPSMHLLIKANLLGIQYVKGNYSGVRELFYKLFKEKNDAPADFLELLYKADSKRMNTLSGKDKVFLAEDLLETLDLLNKKRYDPFWFYQSGQLSLIIGDKVKALDFFRRSYTLSPPDAHYHGAAGTLLRKLENTH